MVNPLTRFGKVATAGIFAPLVLSSGNPTEAIESNKVNPQIINPDQPTTLVERGSRSPLFNNPATLIAETPRGAIANRQGGRFQFENGEEGSRIIRDTQTRAIDTARDAQRRIDENNANIGRRNQRIQEGVGGLSGRNPLDFIK